MKIVPTGSTLKDMKREAEECEYKADLQNEPHANVLREKAIELREWIARLKTGRWTSWRKSKMPNLSCKERDKDGAPSVMDNSRSLAMLGMTRL